MGELPLWDEGEPELLSFEHARDLAIKNGYVARYGEGPIEDNAMAQYRQSLLGVVQVGKHLNIPPRGYFFDSVIEDAEVKPEITFAYKASAAPNSKPGISVLFHADNMPRLAKEVKKRDRPEGALEADALQLKLGIPCEVFARTLQEAGVETVFLRDPDTGRTAEYLWPQDVRVALLALMKARGAKAK